MNITIEFKNVYGETKAYPVCERAKTFASMLGTKTLTRDAIRHIEALGFTINAVDAWGGVHTAARKIA
jgi:hypothetical protein